MESFIFYKDLDSPGADIEFVGAKSIPQLMELCLNNKRCVGFNTLGFLKHNILQEVEFRRVGMATEHSPGGLYVHVKRLEKLRDKIKNSISLHLKDYKFYPGLDSPGDDIGFHKTTITHLKEIADRTPECRGFNTMGFLKSVTLPESQLKKFSNLPHEGLYVKVPKLRIKLLCNWTDSKGICEEWKRMAKDGFCWNNIEVTWEDNVDLFVIINKPNGMFIPQRSIIFQMEPWCESPDQHWGVKTWGEWANPDPHKFLEVRTHRTHVNNCFWQLATTYNEFKTLNIKKTKGDKISCITTSKYFDPGHIKRIDFLKFIETKADPIVTVDIWGGDNQHGFSNYVGSHPKGYKDAGILNYKYYFMAENNSEKNFITEKIWEPLLTETLCFYWGCPNISEYIDPRAYIELPLDDFETSFQIIKSAILNDEWSKRLEVIRREKQKVLEYYNFFPTLERIIGDLHITPGIEDPEITAINYFRRECKDLKRVCFFHSAMMNSGRILHEMLSKVKDTGLYSSLDKIFLINVGPKLELSDPKIHLINYSDNLKLFEFPTLRLLWLFSHFVDAKILYIHTKGVTYQDPRISKFVEDWRNMMIYFLVEKYSECLTLLDKYDTLGCDYKEKPKRHYSGNFWWSTSNYIKTLEKLEYGNRHDCEWWIQTGTPNKYVMHDSKNDYYVSGYPRERYT